MTLKEWTPQEIRDLIDLAAQKGIKARQIAEALGIHPVTLSQWASPTSGKVPSVMARHALTNIERIVKQKTWPEFW